MEESFSELVEWLPGPRIFKKWGLFSLVAGMLETRVYYKTGHRNNTYPNLYIMLVANPAVGKSAIIRTVGTLWSRLDMKVGPDSITKASLVDFMDIAQQTDVGGADLRYTHVNLASDEWGQLAYAHDTGFTTFMSTMYDCNPVWQENRRKFGKDANHQIKLERPSLNVFGGIQPAILSEVFPVKSVGQGLTRRILYIWSPGETPIDVFSAPLYNYALEDEIVRELRAIKTLKGEFVMTPEAKAMLSHFLTVGAEETKLKMLRLQDYNSQRPQLLGKLAMVMSVVRGNSLVLEKQDVERAMAELFAVEEIMPQAFNSVLEINLDSIMNLAVQYLFDIYMQTQKQPLNEQIVRDFFLAKRIPPEKVLPYIEELIHGGRVQAIYKDVVRKTGSSIGGKITTKERFFIPIA